eukprot:8296442-Ditylum_brightwellii.AAC.1
MKLLTPISQGQEATCAPETLAAAAIVALKGVCDTAGLDDDGCIALAGTLVDIVASKVEECCPTGLLLGCRYGMG